MKVDGRFGFEKPTYDVQRRRVNLSLEQRFRGAKKRLVRAKKVRKGGGRGRTVDLA